MGSLIFRLLFLILGLSLFSVLPACSEKQQASLSESAVGVEHEISRVCFLSYTGEIKATVNVETVSSPEKLQLGLMFRKSLPQENGMLFLMAERKILSFWMKNTYIPLSIAYIDDGMRIVDIHKMRPLDERTHYVSSAPCRYAVEVNQGWFKANGIKKRDKVSFLRD